MWFGTKTALLDMCIQFLTNLQCFYVGKFGSTFINCVYPFEKEPPIYREKIYRVLILFTSLSQER